MSRNAYTKSQIFLLEFIIVVLFFALCATVCVSAFVKADRLSESSRERNQAVILMQSAAECIKTLEGEELQGDPLGAAEGVLTDHMGGETAFTTADGEICVPIYYDGDFRQTDKASAEHAMLVDLKTEGGMLIADISIDVMDEKAVLTVKKYI